MKIDTSTIPSPKTRAFYALTMPHHQVLIDFYTNLPEEQYDTRIVDTPLKKADTPRQSLAHILYVQLVYLKAMQTKKLEFKSVGTEHYQFMPKEQLLTEWQRIDLEMYGYLTSSDFSEESTVDVPWGGTMNSIDLLFFLKDHEILHIGWNLAIMDYVNMPRYPSLIQYWGP